LRRSVHKAPFWYTIDIQRSLSDFSSYTKVARFS
jgi:hypothetical protein